MKTIVKAHKFRAYPTLEQVLFFEKSFGCVRLLWNTQVAEDKEHYAKYKTGEVEDYYKPAKVSQYKKQYEFMGEIDSLALANVQQNYRKAKASAFRRLKRKQKAGFPTFHSKHGGRNSYTTNNQHGTVKFLDDAHIKLPKVGTVKLDKQPKPFGCEIKTATISKDSTGCYYVSVSVIAEIEPLPKTGGMAGLDLNLSDNDYVVLSDGTRYQRNRFELKARKKLAREQRKLAKKRLIAKKQGRELKECKNYIKQRIKTAKVYKKTTNQRDDYQHKITRNIIESQDVIVIENLNIAGMLKNHKLAKSISDASFGELIRKLRYKADWYGKTIVEVDRWFPSSKLCSTCGFKHEELTLGQKEWACTNCGETIDRDLNASLNLYYEGKRILGEHGTGFPAENSNSLGHISPTNATGMASCKSGTIQETTTSTPIGVGG